MNLTERESEIVALLRRDSLLDSTAIATALGTTRAAVNVHLSNLGKKGVILGRGYVLGDGPSVVVIGGANMDIKATSANAARPGTSNPGLTTFAAGGVGRNVAENLARLGTRTSLVAVVGADALGDQVLAATSDAGVRVEHVRRSAHGTGTYTAVLDADGELVIAVADMRATAELTPAAIDEARDLIATASLVVLDGNLAAATLGYALDLAAASDVPVILEPVSVPKAEPLRALLDPERPIHVITPNRDELGALVGRTISADTEIADAVRELQASGVTHVWVRLGEHGSLWCGPDGETVALPAVAPSAVVDVTGAGDAMLAAFCHATLAGEAAHRAAEFAHAAAALTIASPHTVRPDLTDRLVRRLR
ncbi:PfkB family carbohydrate kinase [Nocardioides sp. Bht2]|uniref:PfkB family carbohydrate kinase n=1 Tax=Nocardioides sp. Bht2 TaxID=3392297 RepID=UPI0039B55DF2